MNLDHVHTWEPSDDGPARYRCACGETGRKLFAGPRRGQVVPDRVIPQSTVGFSHRRQVPEDDQREYQVRAATSERLGAARGQWQVRP